MTDHAELFAAEVRRQENLLQRAAEELAEMFGVHRQLDKLLYQ